MFVEEKAIINYKKQQFTISFALRKGKKATLCFLHGLGCKKEDFATAFEYEGLKDYTLMCFDFPGCGHSNYPVNLTLLDLAHIAGKLISQLQLEKIVVIGHSMGGAVALLYLQNDPNSLGFINIEGNLTSKDCTFSRRAAHCSLEELKNEKIPELQKLLGHFSNPGSKQYSKWLSQIDYQAYLDYSISLVNYSDHHHLLNKYNNLAMAKIYVYGAESQKNIPFSKEQTIEISNSNHFPFYDNPKEFYQKLASFAETLI